MECKEAVEAPESCRQMPARSRFCLVRIPHGRLRSCGPPGWGTLFDSAAFLATALQLKGGEEGNAEHRKIRGRVKNVIDWTKSYKILRDCRQRGNGLRPAVQTIARMHNVAFTA